MALRLFDLTKTECRSLCWCTPVRGLGRKLTALRKQHPPIDVTDTAAEIVEDVTTPGGGHLRAAAFVRQTRSGRARRYLVQVLMRVRSGEQPRHPHGVRRGLQGEKFLAFLERVLPQRKESVPIRICAELSYDLAQKRSLFNLPVELVSETDKDKRLRGARLSGIELSFEADDNPFDHLHIAVTDSGKRLRVRFGARDRVSLGNDPVGVVYRRANEIAGLFLEEVKRE